MDMYIDIDYNNVWIHFYVAEELADESKRMCQQVVNDRVFDALRRGITDH